MSGKIKTLIDNLIEQRAKGNPSLESTTRTKLLLKGIDGAKYTASSDDDPVVIEKIRQIAKDMGVQLTV
ncbi:hypothetical protein [Methanospirillum lacunae]|uniref:Uncharacterized protein n=1 Tax=Methanospirillum lacunae TaxID=668570 RepID=A0A2V2N491_9EURY|nr:hypothetical protein [Methanospirillum lacunae]PWR71338.1 hypothetical protein DK846_10760 [Methanospirillum lacunae]